MRIVCFGDSLTSCGGPGGRFSDVLQHRFPGHRFINRGVGGETIADALLRLETDVLAASPEVVLVALAANDWWRDERPPEAWARDLETIVTRIRSVGATPVVLGVFGPQRDLQGRLCEKTWGTDGRGRRYRDLEADVARRHRCPYVPNIQEYVMADRCCWLADRHPNEFGNRCVADSVQPILEQLLATAARPVRRIRGITLRDLWDDAVTLAPNRPAAIDADRRVTFAEADRKARCLAAAIRRRTDAPRPIVAWFLPNGLDAFLLYWAVVRLGGVVAPLNTWLPRDGLAAILDHLRPDLLVTADAGDRAATAAAIAAATATDIPILSLADTADNAALPADATPDPAPAATVRQDDLAAIVHTSGTTDRPKGATMRHRDILFNVAAAINAHHFSVDDVHLLINPMFHCAPIYTQLPVAALHRTPLVITGDAGPENLLGLVERHRATTFLTVPAILQRIVAAPGRARFDTRSLRLIAYAGAPMPAATVQRLREAFPGVRLHHFFGLTETVSITHVMDVTDASEHSDAIGTLLPFVRARVADAEGREQPPNSVGELLIARDNVIPGYYRSDRLDAALSTVDGTCWFHTGDLASCDAEGRFTIRGRKKEMIIVGGENVFAAEVEAVIASLPGVREVAVKGVPATGVREQLGELIKACIVRDGDAPREQDIRRHCHRHLPSYKRPHLIVFAAALPRTPSGKVLKELL